MSTTHLYNAHTFVLMFLSCLLASFLFFECSAAAPVSEWKRRVIYQVLTDRFAGGNTCNDLSDYCGGTFKALQQNLDYIQELGADAIWISPIPSQTPKGYHGYWLKDLWSVNERFGSMQDLRNLVDEAHRRGMLVALDVVMNHVGPLLKAGDYSIISPFNNAQYYHKPCSIDWNNQTSMENCWLFNLPDLDQRNEFVSTQLLSWTKYVIETIGFDGLRIDTAPYVPLEWWDKWKQNVVGNTFSFGEVLVGNRGMDYYASYARTFGSILSYPMYYTILNSYMRKKSLKSISSLLQLQRKTFPDSTALVTFIDNHDNPRALNITYDLSLYQNALLFVLAGEGIPTIYYGSEQGFHGGQDPYCREPLFQYLQRRDTQLFRFISTFLAFRRKHVDVFSSSPHVEHLVSDELGAYSFSRGKTLVVTSNAGSSSGSQTIQTTHPFKNGEIVCDLFAASSCTSVTDSVLTVVVDKGMPKVLVSQSML